MRLAPGPRPSGTGPPRTSTPLPGRLSEMGGGRELGGVEMVRHGGRRVEEVTVEWSCWDGRRGACAHARTEESV